MSANTSRFTAAVAPAVNPHTPVAAPARQQHYPLVFGDVDPEQPLYSRTQLLGIFRSMCVEFDEAAHIQAIFHNPNSTTPAPSQPPFQLSTPRPSPEDLLLQQQQQPKPPTASSTIANYQSLFLERPLPPLSISLEWKRQQHLEKQQTMPIRDDHPSSSKPSLSNPSGSNATGQSQANLPSPDLFPSPSGMSTTGLVDGDQTGFTDPLALSGMNMFNDPISGFGFGGFPAYHNPMANPMTPTLLQPQLSADPSQTASTNPVSPDYMLSNLGQPRPQYMESPYGFQPPAQQPQLNHQLMYQFDLVRMFPHRDQPIWYYLDQLHQQQGPFPTESMSQWFIQGYLTDQLPIRFAGHSPIDGKHYEIHYFPLIHWFVHGKPAFLEHLPPRYAHLVPQFMPPTMGNPLGHPHAIMHAPFNPMVAYQGVPGAGPMYGAGAIATPGMPLDPHLAPTPTTSSPLAVHLDHPALLGQSGTDFGIPQLQTQVDPYTAAIDTSSPPLEISNSTIYSASTSTGQFQVDQPPQSPPDNFASLGYIPDELEDEEVDPQPTPDQPVAPITSPQTVTQHVTEVAATAPTPVKRGWGAIPQPVVTKTQDTQSEPTEEQRKAKDAEASVTTETKPSRTYVERVPPIDYEALENEDDEDEDQYSLNAPAPTSTQPAAPTTAQPQTDLPSTRVERLAPVERAPVPGKENKPPVGQTPVKRGWGVIPQPTTTLSFDQGQTEKVNTATSSSGWAKAASRAAATTPATTATNPAVSDGAGPITVVSRPTTTVFSSATIAGKSASEVLKPSQPVASAWGKPAATASIATPSTPVKVVAASQQPAVVQTTPAKVDSKPTAQAAQTTLATPATPAKEPEATSGIKPMSADFHKWFAKELHKLFGSSDTSGFDWLWEIEDRGVVRETLLDISGSRQFADDFIHYRELDLKNGAFAPPSSQPAKKDDPKQWKTASGGAPNSDAKLSSQPKSVNGVSSNNSFAALGTKHAQTFQPGKKSGKK